MWCLIAEGSGFGLEWFASCLSRRFPLRDWQLDPFVASGDFLVVSILRSASTARRDTSESAGCSPSSLAILRLHTRLSDRNPTWILVPDFASRTKRRDTMETEKTGDDRSPRFRALAVP